MAFTGFVIFYWRRLCGIQVVWKPGCGNQAGWEPGWVGGSLYTIIPKRYLMHVLLAGQPCFLPVSSHSLRLHL